MYGRGISDMKGNVLATVFAVEACLRNGGLPVNVKFFVEGQEEIGSPDLGNFLRQHQDLLAADICLNPDTGMLSPEHPTITYALRGLAYFELNISGPTKDLHSGLYGGALLNPAQALAELIAGMHDSEGRVTLPGFYDDVRELTDGERNRLATLPIHEQDFLNRTGIPAIWGESGYSFYERITARPTLEVNGLLSGFTGEGSKTVIPSGAMAKISCRLVPDQVPEKIHQSLLTYLERTAPDTIRWSLRELVSGHPSISDIESPLVGAMAKALARAFGSEPLFRREGGSVPVVADLQHILGMETINVGIGLPDDNQHGPNEKMHLPSFYRQIDSFIHFFRLVAETSPSAFAQSKGIASQ
jgi:acetylornithine deacetylase/succinyl-diaminopimelate desuccinylase-like protein